MQKQVIGIIGGLGPHATVELERRILVRVDAKCDQDYPTLITYNNPCVPDRTEALLYGGESPLPELVRSAKVLVNAGATTLCMPCNTAHAFVPAMCSTFNGATFVHMIDEACERVLQTVKAGGRVGVLCTDGTRASRLYTDALQLRGLTVVYPTGDDQELVMRSIYGERGLKAGKIEEPSALFQEVINRLMPSVDGFLIACTELSLARVRASVPIVDALDTLADAVVSRAMMGVDKAEDKQREKVLTTSISLLC